MTTADAIEYFEKRKLILASINLPGLESCEKALEALRLMQEIEEMKPLVVQAKETAELDQMMREIKNHKPTIFISEPEIVLCQDCYKRYDENLCPMCMQSEGELSEYTFDDGYCDRGERRDDDGR